MSKNCTLEEIAGLLLKNAENGTGKSRQASYSYGR